MLMSEKKKYERKNKNIEKAQAYLDKLTKKSILLFENKSDWYDEKDFHHYIAEEIYLSPQNNLIDKKIMTTVDAHNIVHCSSITFINFLSFDQFNDIVRKSDNAEAKKYSGITEHNCKEYFLEIQKNSRKKQF